MRIRHHVVISGTHNPNRGIRGHDLAAMVPMHRNGEFERKLLEGSSGDWSDVDSH